MQNRISTRLVNSIQPAARVFEIRDTLLKGFILRVQPSGTKTYICEYTRGKRQTIGRASVVAADQARAMARNIIAEYRLNGTVIPKRQPAAPTLSFFINYEYAPWQLANNKRGYEEIDRIRRHFLPTLGKKPLNEITPLLVERWRIQRLESGMKPITVNRQLASLKAAMYKAVTWGFIHEHPLARMKLLKVDTNPNPRYLTEEEELALRQALDDREAAYRARRESGNQRRQLRGYEPLKCLPDDEYLDHLKPMVLLTLNTGLRRGELFTLRWSDIDLEHRNLTVAGSYAKSGTTRQIPLNDEAVEVLEQWLSQTGPDSGFVFTGKVGGKVNNVRKACQKLLQDAGIEHFRWHDLRHHFASKLVMSGVDLNTVRELLGHSTITMTLRYAHLAPEHKAAAVARIAYGTSRKGKVIPFKQRGR